MDRSGAIEAGALAGLAGLAAFLAVHHVLILPIWFVSPIGALIAAGGGATVGAAYAELRPKLPGRPWTAPVLMLLFAIVLLPAFVLAELRGPVFAMTDNGDAVLVVPVVDVALAFASMLLTAALVGLAIGWLIARTRRAALLTGAAGFVFALGPGHNIPFLGGTSGVPKELALMAAAIATASVVLVEVHAWRTRGQRDRSAVAPRRSAAGGRTAQQMEGAALVARDGGRDGAREDAPDAGLVAR